MKEFVTQKEVLYLEDMLEKILIDVLNIKSIHDHVSKKVESEVNNLLRDEEFIQNSINILSSSLEKYAG